jgi:hypothetical protein
MLILEAIYKYIIFPIVRLILWLLTARDCYHCIHYDRKWSWCERSSRQCKKYPWRKNFKRRSF